MSLDLAVIGVVFAIILLIIFFSAVVLYLSFRIKETFRKETRKGATVVKVAFLIGILFLAGGVFYFFANTFTNIADPSATPTPTPAQTPTPTPSPTSTPSQNPLLSFSISAPDQVGMNSELSVSFTINNPTDFTANNVYIETDGLFSDFTVQSFSHEISGSVINIGQASSGITIVNLEVISPTRARTYTNTITLNYQEMSSPLTETLTIYVRGS